MASFEGCPDLDIYELPDKIMVEGEYLGKTNLYRTDMNVTSMLGDTDVFTKLKGIQHSYKNAVIMPMELLMDIIDYTASLRVAAEKYKADREAVLKRDNNATIESD